MSNFHWDHMRGSSGDSSAPGWGGYLGHEKHRQEQERERLRRSSEAAERLHGSSGRGGASSSKNLVMMVFVLIAFEAFLNVTGFLTSDFQRIAAFVFAVVAGTVVNLYWEIIARVLTAVILLGGAVLLIAELWGR